MKFSMEKSVTRREALALMREVWAPRPGQELIPLEDSLGRVTAEALHAVHTLPVVRASCFDGIAVRRADFQNGLPDTSHWAVGRDYVRADTGDDFPDDFDTVIAIEDVVLEGDGIRFAQGFTFDPTEETVDPAGTIVRSGALLTPPHTRITPELMASLAIGGVTQVPVLKKPRVAFLPTGSELVLPGQQPQRGQNIEANGLMLSALLSRRGAEVIRLPIVRDDAVLLEGTLDQALEQADLVLINGGSSRGEEDFNAQMLERRSTFFRHGVKAVPGRPVAFAVIGGKPVINVPGPVAAAYLAEHWCLSALVAQWYGLPAPEYPKVSAVLEAPMKKRPGFELVGRVALRRTRTGYSARPISWGEDGIPGLLLHTDGFVNIPIDTAAFAAGDIVEVELLKTPELIERAEQNAR